MKTYAHNTDIHVHLDNGERIVVIQYMVMHYSLNFGGDELDERNWIVDFGGLEAFKEWLKFMFDRTYPYLQVMIPEFEIFQMLADKGLIDLRVVGGVGCERFV